MDMAAAGGGIAGLTGQGIAGSQPTPAAPVAPEAPKPTEPPPVPETKAAAPEAVRTSVAPDRAARREAVLRSVQGRAMLPLQRKMETALRGTFQRMRQDALAAVAKMPGMRADNPLLNIDAVLSGLREKYNKQLTERMKPLYAEGVDIGAKTVGDQLGGLQKFDTEQPAVLDFLRTKELRLVGVNETVLDSLRSTLLEGIGQTENLEQIQDRVREVMDTTSARALNVARTEAAQTTNGARNIAMRLEGVESTEWISSKDNHVRDSHVALDGTVVPLGQPFGTSGCRYPCDIEAAAEEVCGCRCVSSPVIAD
jgi:SPP1 gp7 family putative phage head morphogenesis protein